jgi:hypothetical protein
MYDPNKTKKRRINIAAIPSPPVFQFAKPKKELASLMSNRPNPISPSIVKKGVQGLTFLTSHRLLMT